MGMINGLCNFSYFYQAHRLPNLLPSCPSICCLLAVCHELPRHKDLIYNPKAHTPIGVELNSKSQSSNIYQISENDSAPQPDLQGSKMSDFTPAGASTPPHLPPSKLGTKE